MDNNQKYLCTNNSGNKYCDYTVNKPKQCNYEARCNASFLDCQYCKAEENVKAEVVISKEIAIDIAKHLGEDIDTIDFNNTIEVGGLIEKFIYGEF